MIENNNPMQNFLRTNESNDHHEYQKQPTAFPSEDFIDSITLLNIEGSTNHVYQMQMYGCNLLLDDHHQIDYQQNGLFSIDNNALFGAEDEQQHVQQHVLSNSQDDNLFPPQTTLYNSFPAVQSEIQSDVINNSLESHLNIQNQNAFIEQSSLSPPSPLGNSDILPSGIEECVYQEPAANHQFLIEPQNQIPSSEVEIEIGPEFESQLQSQNGNEQRHELEYHHESAYEPKEVEMPIPSLPSIQTRPYYQEQESDNNRPKQYQMKTLPGISLTKVQLELEYHGIKKFLESQQNQNILTDFNDASTAQDHSQQQYPIQQQQSDCYNYELPEVESPQFQQHNEEQEQREEIHPEKAQHVIQSSSSEPEMEFASFSFPDNKENQLPHYNNQGSSSFDFIEQQNLNFPPLMSLQIQQSSSLESCYSSQLDTTMYNDAQYLGQGMQEYHNPDEIDWTPSPETRIPVQNKTIHKKKSKQVTQSASKAENNNNSKTTTITMNQQKQKPRNSGRSTVINEIGNLSREETKNFENTVTRNIISSFRVQYPEIANEVSKTFPNNYTTMQRIEAFLRDIQNPEDPQNSIYTPEIIRGLKGIAKIDLLNYIHSLSSFQTSTINFKYAASVYIFFEYSFNASIKAAREYSLKQIQLNQDLLDTI